MNDFLLLRFILNRRKRVEWVTKYQLNAEVVDVNDFLYGIFNRYVEAIYPIPKSVLLLDYPQYKDFIETLPEVLNDEEEAYAQDKLENILGKSIPLFHQKQRRSNKKFFRSIAEDINDMQSHFQKTEEEYQYFDIKDSWKLFSKHREILKNIVPLPFQKMTRQLAGGVLPGKLYAFEAPNKSKKSMLMMFFGLWFAKQGKKVFYVSTELQELEYNERMYQMLQGFKDPLHIKDYDILTEKEGEALTSDIKGSLGYMFFPPQQTTVKDIEGFLAGKDYDILIIDHASNNHIIPNYFIKNEKEWEAEKRVYGDIFSFTRRSQKIVFLPTFINREGQTAVDKEGKIERHHTAGTFAKNGIVDAMYAIIPERDSDTKMDHALWLRPMFIRRTNSTGGTEDMTRVIFHKSTCHFSEDFTAADSAAKQFIDTQRGSQYVTKKKWTDMEGRTDHP